jgi:hypothetical protein
MRYPPHAINFLSCCRDLWSLALRYKPKVYLYDVRVDSCDATDSGTKVTQLCNHYKLVVIHLQKGLLDILETCTQEIRKYWDQEAKGRSLSRRKRRGPDLLVQVLVFIGADCDQVSGKSEAENKVEYPYPLKVIQKTYQNKLPHILIPEIGFILIDDRFVGYIFREGEALALEEAVAKYEKMERNGGPFSFGIERLWEQHREQIPGDGFLGATPKTLFVVMDTCGFQIVDFIIGVPIR